MANRDMPPELPFPGWSRNGNIAAHLHHKEATLKKQASDAGIGRGKGAPRVSSSDKILPGAPVNGGGSGNSSLSSSTDQISSPPTHTGSAMVLAANPPQVINRTGLVMNQNPGYAHALFASDITTTPMKLPPPPNRSQTPPRGHGPVAGFPSPFGPAPASRPSYGAGNEQQQGSASAQQSPAAGRVVLGQSAPVAGGSLPAPLTLPPPPSPLVASAVIRPASGENSSPRRKSRTFLETPVPPPSVSTVSKEPSPRGVSPTRGTMSPARLHTTVQRDSAGVAPSSSSSSSSSSTSAKIAPAGSANVIVAAGGSTTNVSAATAIPGVGSTGSLGSSAGSSPLNSSTNVATVGSSTPPLQSRASQSGDLGKGTKEPSNTLLKKAAANSSGSVVSAVATGSSLASSSSSNNTSSAANGSTIGSTVSATSASSSSSAAASAASSATAASTSSDQIVINKDELNRRLRALENFNASLVLLTKALLLHCKELAATALDIQAALKARNADVAAHKRQVYLELLVKIPKTASQLSELVENKTKELLMPGVTREQDRVNRCARAVKARVTLLAKESGGILRDIEAGQECADRLGKSTREVADTVRSLVEGANTLRLAERNEQSKVKAKLKAHQEQQQQEFNGLTTNNAMLLKSMLTAVQGEDKGAFVELSKALITGIGPMFAFTKRYKVHREENALRNALFKFLSSAKSAFRLRSPETDRVIEITKVDLIKALTVYIQETLKRIALAEITYTNDNVLMEQKAIKIQRAVRVWLAKLHKNRKRAAAAAAASPSSAANVASVASTSPPTSSATPTDASAPVEKSAKAYALEEVLTSEVVYLNHLRTMIKEFLVPLRKSPSMVAVPFIAKKDLQIVFGNIENIEKVTAEMVEELEKCKDQVGPVFLKMLPKMTDYVEYCANFDRAQERIDILKQNPEYIKFIRQCVNREKGTYELNNYLIMPIQRPPRYRLLLETLLKHTTEAAPEFKVLTDALEATSRFNDEINAYKRDQDNRWKFAEIKKRTTDFPDALYEPNRFWVKEGTLEFMAPRQKKGGLQLLSLTAPSRSNYFFYLFTDVIVRAKLTKKADTYEYVDHIFLSGCSCEEVNDQNKQDSWCFKLVNKAKDEEYLFWGQDETTRKLWMIELENAIQVLEVNALCAST